MRRIGLSPYPLSRGEVVVIRSPITPKRMDLKRIIGLPTEAISWSQGRFQVNDTLLMESYAKIPSAPPGDDEVQACHLGSDEYFVAGDNRLHSCDSRRYGPVNRSAILGTIS